MKKKWRDFSLWKTTQQPDGAMWQMSLDLFVKEFGRLKKDKGTRDWRVSLRLRPWADWQVTSRRRQSPSRSGVGGARESHSSARWPISVLIRRFPLEKKFKISRQNLKKFAPKCWEQRRSTAKWATTEQLKIWKKNWNVLKIYSNLAPIRFKVETDIFLQIELRMCAAGWRCITDVLHENAAWTCHLHLIRWCLQGGGAGNQRHLLTSPTPSIDRHCQQRDDRSIELFVNEWNSGPCSSTSPWRDRCFDTRKGPKRFNSPGDSVNWHVQRATGLDTFWWILTITDGVGGWLCGKRVAINNLPARRLGYSSCSILMVIGGSTISQQGQKAREKTQLMIGPHHHSPHASFSPPPDVE